MATTCLACGKRPVECACTVPAPAVMAGLLDGVNARLDRLEVLAAQHDGESHTLRLRVDAAANRLDELERQVGDLAAARLRDGRRIADLDAQVRGLLRRTRRPGEKRTGRKRT